MDYIDEITDAECDGAHHCDVCSLYGQCRDRRPIEKCTICGASFTDEDLCAGICKDCLTKSVNPYTVREYVSDRATVDNKLWESLFEAYFSTDEDKCDIKKISGLLRERLIEQIVREFYMDNKVKNIFNSKDKLVAWVGEDDVAWGDFAAWLVEKKKI